MNLGYKSLDYFLVQVKILSYSTHAGITEKAI